MYMHHHVLNIFTIKWKLKLSKSMILKINVRENVLQAISVTLMYSPDIFRSISYYSLSFKDSMNDS